MIFIGAVYKGPELKGSSINLSLMKATRLINQLRSATTGESPSLNAVFVVPGSLGKSDFDGLIFGEYSAKENAKVVQIAVPRIGPGEEGQFIVDALRGANAMAFEFFRRRGQIFQLKQAEELVASLASLMDAA
jgi:hypothetical protein